MNFQVLWFGRKPVCLHFSLLPLCRPLSSSVPSQCSDPHPQIRILLFYLWHYQPLEWNEPHWVRGYCCNFEGFAVTEHFSESNLWCCLAFLSTFRKHHLLRGWKPAAATWLIYLSEIWLFTELYTPTSSMTPQNVARWHEVKNIQEKHGKQNKPGLV